MAKCADDYGFCRLTQVSEQAVIPSLDISTPGLAAPSLASPYVIKSSNMSRLRSLTCCSVILFGATISGSILSL